MEEPIKQVEEKVAMAHSMRFNVDIAMIEIREIQGHHTSFHPSPDLEPL